MGGVVWDLCVGLADAATLQRDYGWILKSFLESAHGRFMVVADAGRMLTGSGSRGRRIAVVLAVVGSFGISGACGDGSDTASSGSGNVASDGGGHELTSPVAEGARHVTISARSFAFEPAEITVQAGEDLAVVLTSEDGLHDFTVNEFDAHVSAEQSVTSVGGFRADEPGRYTFYCSIEGHREAGMEGTLVVEQ